MDQPEVASLSSKLTELSRQLHQAVDDSVIIKARDKSQSQEVAKAWENFLGDFMGYVYQRGRESGQNLLQGISFNKIWRR